MAFQYLTNVPLERARREFRDALRCAGFGPEAETIPVQDACGRITAEPVYARICAPHYPACAMDGIALEARATFGATETTPVTLGAEAFTAVNTGDPVPEGCDAVVMADVVGQEDGSVRLHAAAVPWQHIRQIGEDICAGEMILASHVEISPSAMGAMLAAGVLEAAVLRRPVVGIIPTGDEVVPPTASRGTWWSSTPPSFPPCWSSGERSPGPSPLCRTRGRPSVPPWRRRCPSATWCC